jgi:tripartite-type tricarboxylate transporter receptor subunit TctC
MQPRGSSSAIIVGSKAPPIAIGLALVAILRRILMRQLTLVATMLLSCIVAWAQSYPNRIVHIVVPFAAGAPDSVARILAQQLQSQMRQSVIVENRPAANGTIATDSVAKSPPDGHVLLVTSASIAVNPSIYRNLPYNVLTDLETVTVICRTEGYILVVNPSIPAKTVQELVELAHDPNSKLSYGSPGVGNTLHLAGELFKARAGINLTHVPYRGAGPAISDLLGGQIQVMFVTPPLSLAHIQSGKLRPLAYTAAHRWSVLPDVPTMAEAGIADFVMDGGWYGMFAPVRTPTEIVNRLHQEVKAALTLDSVRQNYAVLGLEPVGSSPADSKTFLAEQVRKYAELVRIAKIEPQ